MSDGEDKTDIAVLKNKVDDLQRDMSAMEVRERTRDDRDRAFLVRALITLGGVMTALGAMLWAAIKDRFGL